MTGMYSVRRALRTGSRTERQATVIEAVDIRRSCHLVAKLPAQKPQIPLYLNVDNLLERWDTFRLNNFVDKAAYRTIY